MLARTRRRVSSEIGRLPLSTYDTVLGDTPACRATSAILAKTGSISAEARTHTVGGARRACVRLSKRFD